ncbi:hypothetical protein Hanom_Chr09g00794481 [Helianthus anomalus]
MQVTPTFKCNWIASKKSDERFSLFFLRKLLNYHFYIPQRVCFLNGFSPHIACILIKID